MQSRIRQWFVVAAMAVLLGVSAPVARVGAEVDHRIDINTASAAELATLPGIGDSKAKAIVDYRAADPFHTIEDLKKVKGIGDKTFEALKPNLMVSDASVKKDVGAKK
jgi:comEA protein